MPFTGDYVRKRLVNFSGVVIDGKSLEYAMSKDLQKAFIHLARRCHSVLVCRATPLQKGEIVKLVKDELRVMTLAIGMIHVFWGIHYFIAGMGR